MPIRLVPALVGTALALVAADAFAGRWRYQSPAEPGLFRVGHSVFEVSDPARGGRTIPVDLWVPVEPEDASGTPSLYALVLGIGPTSAQSFDDAPMSPTNGFPLVVYSHGGGGFAVEAGTLMEALASHGIVAAAPSHLGGTYKDGGDPVEVIRRNRVLDVRLVIDALLARSADPDDPLFLRIHP